MRFLKRWHWLGLVALTLLMGVLAVEVTARPIRGWWADEPFYRGRPASWWRDEVARWPGPLS